MATIDLFFVAICKDDYVCHIEQGPLPTEDEAREFAEEPFKQTRCYRAVVKITLPCEILE